VDVERVQALVAEAEAIRPRLRGAEAGVARARLEEIYPELEDVLAHSVASGDVDAGLRLTAALVPFWLATDRLAEGDRWCDRVLERGGGDPASRARSTYEHGYLVFWAGRDELAARRATEAIALAREIGQPTITALALGVLARIALRTDVDEAKRLLVEALAVTEGTSDTEGRSSAMHVLGVAHQMSGDLEAASVVMGERLALGRQQGDAHVVAVESANLSMVERQRGDLDRAAALARDALLTFRRLGDALAVAWSANSAAAVAAARGDLPLAATLLGFAEAGVDRAGTQWPPDEREQYDETLTVLRAGLPKRVLEAARATGQGLSAEQVLSIASPQSA
jgi:non-specific serine/threonine protein kinase